CAQTHAGQIVGHHRVVILQGEADQVSGESYVIVVAVKYQDGAATVVRWQPVMGRARISTGHRTAGLVARPRQSLRKVDTVVVQVFLYRRGLAVLFVSRQGKTEGLELSP